MLSLKNFTCTVGIKIVLLITFFSVGCSDPQGACCIGNTCDIQSRADCEEQGGKYFGDSNSDSPCNEALKENPCFCKKTGACCIGTTCQIICGSQCASLGGDYKGEGSDCSEDPCKPPPPSMKDLISGMGLEDFIYQDGDDLVCVETEGGRRRVLEFLGALFTGEPEKIQNYLSDVERQELSEMTKSGDWQLYMGSVERIDFKCGSHPNGFPAIHVQLEFLDSSLQDTVWILKGEGESTRFEAVPMPPDFYAFGNRDVMDVLWEKLAELPDIAAEADEVIQNSPIDLTTGSEKESQPKGSGGRGGR